MELIDKFINREKGGEDFTWIANNLIALEKRMEAINNKSISIELDLRTDNATLEKVLANTQKLHDANQKLLDVSESLTSNKKNLNAASKVAIDHEKRMAALTKDLNKEREKTNRLLAQLNNKIAQTEDAERRREQRLRKREEEKVQKERINLAKQLIAEKKKLQTEADRLEQKAFKEAAAMEKQNTAFNRANNEHKKLLAAARDIGVAEGANSVAFLKAAAAANEMGNKLKAIDGRLGIHSRNVGNYTTAWNGLNYSVSNLISEIPNLAQGSEIFFRAISNNLLPLGQQIQMVIEKNKLLAASGQATVPVWRQMSKAIFGWQSLLIIGITLLSAYGDELVKFITRGKDVSTVFKETTSLLSDMGDEHERVAAEIRTLDKLFHASNTTAEQKSQIVKQLDKDYGGIVGTIKTYADAEKFFVEQAPAYVESMKQRALADAAYAAIAKNNLETLMLERDPSKSLDVVDKIQAFFRATATKFKAELGTKDGAGSFGDYFKEALGIEAFNEAYEDTVEIDKKTRNLEEIATNAEKAYNAIVAKMGFNTTGEKDKKDKKEDKSTAVANMVKELQKAILEADVDFQKQSLETAQHNNDLIFKDDKSTFDERLAARHAFYAAELALLSLEQGKREAANAIEHEDNLARINSIAKTKEEKEKLVALETDRYNKVVAASLESYTQQSAQALNSYVDEVTDLTDKNAADTDKRIRKNLDRIRDYLKDNAEDAALSWEEYLERIKVKMQEVTKVMGYFIEIGNNIASVVYEPQIAKQDQIIENINASRDLELARIKATSTSEVEANERIAEYEARRYVANQIAEREKIRLRVKQAQIEKVGNIASVISRGALAVVDAFIEGGPLMAALAAATVASQVAVAAAAPLPQYYKGVESSPATWAWVGERGRELRVDPDGNISVTPDKPTLTYLEKGTKIIPNKPTNEILSQMKHEITSTHNFVSPETLYRVQTNRLIKNNNLNTDKLIAHLNKKQKTESTPMLNNDFTDKVISKYKR